MEQYEISERNRVKRAPKRGIYDKERVYQILDEGKVGHVAFTFENRPLVIPMTYGREGDNLYLHGAQTSRLMTTLEKGIEVAVGVTLIDALVLARSVFHHSMNYRSVVVFGKAELVQEPQELQEAFRIITEHLVPGRWQEARQPSPKETKGTKVLKVSIQEASAKARTGPPVDEKADLDLPIWAGILPLQKGYESPMADEQLKENVALPPSIDLIKKQIC